MCQCVCVTSYHRALESCAISMLFFHYRGLMKIYMDIEVGWGLKPQGLRQSDSWLWLCVCVWVCVWEKQRGRERVRGRGMLGCRWSFTWWKKYMTWKPVSSNKLSSLISPSLSSDTLHLHCQLKLSLFHPCDTETVSWLCVGHFMWTGKSQLRQWQLKSDEKTA